MQDDLYNYLMKLPKANLINLMWSALDEMQAYNGRSRMFCIMEAMGAELADDDNNEQRGWKKLPFAKAKRNTAVMGL